jgi:adenylyltransferase/sulfurtransferase
MVVNVTPQRAWELISKGEVEVVDVRDPGEWEKGHIPGARLVPLAQVRAGAGKALPPSGILFVCAGGVRSQTAARIALEQGITRVFSVIGGTSSWIKAGLPLTTPLQVAV